LIEIVDGEGGVFGFAVLVNFSGGRGPSEARTGQGKSKSMLLCDAHNLNNSERI